MIMRNLILQYFKEFIDITFKRHEAVHRYLINHGGVEKMVDGLTEQVNIYQRRNHILSSEKFRDTIKELSYDCSRQFCLAAINNQENLIGSKFSKTMDFSDDPFVKKKKAEIDAKQKQKEEMWDKNQAKMERRLRYESGKIVKGYESDKTNNEALTSENLGPEKLSRE